ncbi:hypothetical protein [Geobacter sp. AOG1]|uniref:hypothetical protein n=1 Tax=Geobacter sp. AOG1 TaxID=1566346 RepID=UPI001CC7172B|nr:hypothetical protein [Geobacter sp. AOG1]GFE58624.1 hypothetical protein AOG1_25040 [Geobacter sp. AOG1]
MSRLIRMAYGHGGTRLERILVTASPAETKPMPRWLQLLLLVSWIVALVLFSRYAVHTIPHQTTAIDTSRLELMPPPALPEPPHVMPAEPQPPAPLQSEQKPQERPQEDLPPTINRPAQRAPEAIEYQPRIARERASAVTDVGASAAPQVRRGAAMNETAAERTTITRSRGASTAEAPAATERIAPLRRARGAEGTPSASEPELRPITRKERTSGTIAGSTQQVMAARERTAGVAGDEKGSSSLSPARGVSFASLEICASPREEEEKITAVLGVVGGRQSCRNGSGEYRFTGTRRISSFNLIIFPAKGRKPTNRCEELENAYRCLEAR